MKYLAWVMGIVIGLSSFASAQTISPTITVDAVPANPQPGATVTITARSYEVDLSQSQLSWTYGGKSVAQGTGKTSIQVVAPASGVSSTVSVTITGAGFDTTTASVILRPGSLDVLWEAVDAYTPPFYKGKALLPVGGTFRVTAIPTSVAPKNLSFSWERNGSALESASGFGKSSILVKHSALTPQEQITVSTGSGTYSGTSTVRITPYAPLALVYKNIDGFIDYANGFASSIPFTSQGLVLHFEPYYFSVPTSMRSDLSFDITAGNDTVPTSIPNEIALSRPDSPTTSTLTVAITTVAYSLQHLEKTFTLLFN